LFTGLVEEIGTVKELQTLGGGIDIKISCHIILEDIYVDASIAVNGCCLTVTSYDGHSFSATAIRETLSKTNLAELSVGSDVNLERAMKAGDRLGGHSVQGHIDCTTPVTDIEHYGTSTDIYYKIPDGGRELIVDRGSITIDGISLTIAETNDQVFKVSIIPHTWEHTVISQHSLGYLANIEYDINAKLIQKMIEPYINKYLKKQ
jgi:riboflavin synthase